jgi:hypothetical protein
MKPQPLSGLVAKGSTAHKHRWQRARRFREGALWYLHVCLDHSEPVIKAYDVFKPGNPVFDEAAKLNSEAKARRGRQRARTN